MRVVLAIVIFSILFTATAHTVLASANIVIDGNPDDWKGIKPIMIDPEDDGVNVQGSDLKALYAYKDSSFLYLMLEVYNNPNGASERVQYIFEISNTVDSPFLKWDYQPGGDAQGGTWLWNLTEYDTRVNYKNPNPYGLTMPIPGAEAMGRTVFEMKVPLFLIGNPENMIIRARTVDGEDKWADDMPSAKFITNPSLIQKSADTKTSTPVSTLLPPSEANQDNASKGNSDWNLIGGGIFIVIIVGIIISMRNRTSPQIEYDPDFPENTASGIEIRRGYFVLQNNDIKFGVRITNNTDYAILDADSILDYTKTLFSMKDSEIQHLGNITPDNARTATYVLKPLGCIHNEQINALVTYKDHTGKKQTVHMRPKEVHCVCPFLKEKPMNEAEYGRLAANSEFVQEGIAFKGISVEELAKFMGETCRHMLYKVREYNLEGKKVIYLSGESLGEKAYYLLTAVIQEHKGLSQVVLRAHSDKKYGLNGFMNEMAYSIRHLVGSVQNAKEIGIIENTQVINIIDSVVQRTSFNMGEGGKAQVNIRESMMQRSNIGASARKCPDCGREVEANEKFCLGCGAKLS